MDTMFVVRNTQSSFWEICLQQSEPHELIIKQSKGNQEAGVSLGLCRGERLRLASVGTTVHHGGEE